jgi:hypothetical protein
MLSEKTMYQLSIQAIRYAQSRDNDIAPLNAIDNIKEILQELKDYKKETIHQLINEITHDLRFYKRKSESIWEDFKVFLEKEL